MNDYPDTQHASDKGTAAGFAETSAASAKPSRRRRPRTDEERLAKALAEAESLREKLEAKRDENRVAAVERLYAALGIDAIHGDVSEKRRLDALLDAVGANGSQ